MIYLDGMSTQGGRRHSWSLFTSCLCGVQVRTCHKPTYRSRFIARDLAARDSLDSIRGFFSFARKLAYDADACSPDVLERVACVCV